MSVNSFVNNFNESATFLSSHPFIFAILVVWTIVWKGLALWKASRLSHKVWFVIILVANTFGILEIIYLLFVARKYKVTTETDDKVTEEKKVM